MARGRLKEARGALTNDNTDRPDGQCYQGTPALEVTCSPLRTAPAVPGSS